MTTLREKLIKIGTKVVHHGRYITFQLAEVAIPRSLFANIRRLNDGLLPAAESRAINVPTSAAFALDSRLYCRIPRVEGVIRGISD